MCRSGGRGRAAGLLALALAAAGSFLPSRAAAQASAAQLSGVELAPAASSTLQQIQEAWLQWMSAYYQDREAETHGTVEDLRAALALTGLERLPDLSIGAAVRAAESARQGNLERASWGLMAAEALDPGRPETAFARAVWNWESGRRIAALVEQVRGYWRALDLQLFRFLIWQNFVAGTVAWLLVAGAGFVLLLLAVRGSALYRELLTVVRGLPRAVAHPAALALLLWPLLLPGGVLWLLFYLAILLWAHAARSERLVLVFLWLVLALGPVVVARQQERVPMMLSPPSQAVQGLAEGRLYGELFTDLGVLRTVLPNEPAVKELLADVHRMLGQWEQARDAYEEVLSVETGNLAAQLNLGAYYFRKADYGTAVRYFQSAAALDPEDPVAFYNLSQAYSESYLFEEQRQALGRAQALDSVRVNRWIRQPPRERVITRNGGIERAEEIQRALSGVWGPEDGDARGLGRAVPLVLPVLALALAWLHDRFRPAVPAAATELPAWLAGSLAVVTPGLRSLEAGRGATAFLAMAALALLLLVVFQPAVGFDLPWGLQPAGGVAAWAGLLGLAALYAGRAWRFSRA